jgi:MarR family 2-MHQ and catechol resistance regulon transcriptional repressor
MPTHYQGEEKVVQALNLFIKLTRAAESVNAELKARNSMGGLTISQFGTLETLYFLGPLTQGEIGRKLLKSSGNMTLVIDNLERDGLVRRERSDEDRRRVLIHLTYKGRRLIEGIFPQHAEDVTGIMRVLTAEEQEVLEDLLRKLGKGEKA